jgi:hypothetical protein
MDVINNTLGTVLGSLCCRPRFVQKLLALFAIVSLEDSAANPALGDALLKAS